MIVERVNERQLTLVVVVIDHFSGLHRAISRVCVSGE